MLLYLEMIAGGICGGLLGTVITFLVMWGPRELWNVIRFRD